MVYDATTLLTLVAYVYLILGVIIAGVMWHLLHDPATLAAASKDPVWQSGLYPWAVALFCLMTIFLWPLTSAYWVRKSGGWKK